MSFIINENIDNDTFDSDWLKIYMSGDKSI